MAVSVLVKRSATLCACVQSGVAVALFAIGCLSYSSLHAAELAYLAVTDGYWEVWTANADGGKSRQVTKSKSDKARVSWMPDGAHLLVSCNDGRVVIVDLQGNEKQIALEQRPVVDAVASPDGRRLAFSFSTAIDGNDIWLTNIDGSGSERLVRMASLQHEPVWSPDGRSLYFLSGDGGQAHDIWRTTLEKRGTEQVTVGSLYHFDIAVSTTGELAFSSNRSGNYEIYLQHPGGTAEAVTNDPALDAHPAFSPDGTQLVFESSRGGTLNLWHLDLKSRSLRQITRHREGVRAPVWHQAAP